MIFNRSWSAAGK